MEQPGTSIVIRDLVTGPIPPRPGVEGSPNTLHTRVAEVVDKMGPPPWSKRVIADERNLVTLIASAPGGGNRPHWHREFDEWWVVLAGRLQWELTGGIVVDAVKDDIVWVPRGTVPGAATTAPKTRSRGPGSRGTDSRGAGSRGG